MIKTILLAAATVSLVLFWPVMAERYRAEDTEKMMTLKDIDVMGVNLTMTMGEIFANLRAQGLEPECRGSVCQINAHGLNVTIQHAGRSGSRVNTQVDEKATPVSIGFSAKEDMSRCEPVKDMIAKYCNKDDKKQPCFTDLRGHVQGNFSGAGKSADGYHYSGAVVLWPGTLCNLNVRRMK